MKFGMVCLPSCASSVTFTRSLSRMVRKGIPVGRSRGSVSMALQEVHKAAAGRWLLFEKKERFLLQKCPRSS